MELSVPSTLQFLFCSFLEGRCFKGSPVVLKQVCAERVLTMHSFLSLVLVGIGDFWFTSILRMSAFGRLCDRVPLSDITKRSSQHVNYENSLYGQKDNGSCHTDAGETNPLF